MRRLKKNFHIVIFDGPTPGQVSFSIENVSKGTEVALPNLPKGVKAPRMPITDPFVYQFAVNGLLAVGGRIREIHQKCSAEADVTKKCDICQLSLLVDSFFKGIVEEQRKKMEAKRGEVKIPFEPPRSKIILPNDGGLPGDKKP